MSPAAQGNLDHAEQYGGNCFINQNIKFSNNGFPKQNSRQFHNSQNRNNTYQVNQFCKNNNYNGNRVQKFNSGYLRQGNYVDQTGWNNGGNLPQIVNQRRFQQYPVNNQYNNKQRKSQDFVNGNDPNRTPFTRIVVHNQNPGANPNGNPKFNSKNKSQFSRNNQKSYQNEKVEKNKPVVEKVPNNQASDVLSNVSDESSGHSENSLPRIIKPRKRRKKDRKPLTENNVETNNSSPSSVEVQNLPKTVVKPQVKPSPVTVLKQYRPVPFEQPKQIQILAKPVAVNRQETVYLHTNPTEESIFSPLVTDSFVNLLLDEGKQNNNGQMFQGKPLDTLVTLTPGKPLESLTPGKDEEPNTVCQCRYCDPSGEIWDVEQRCYSPFLTPPSPNEPKLFINSIRPVISNGQLTRTNNTSLLLRRSWSEPSTESPSPVNLGMRLRNKSDSYEPNSNDLQVSSEIITSPNGHRDIEIKFFSPSKKHSELHKPNLYSTHHLMYLTSPPVSPWKKEVRFCDMFSQVNEMRSAV